MIGQRTTSDGWACLARPWQATLALALALLAGTGTAAAQDTMPPGLKSARLLGTKLMLAFDKPVVINETSRLMKGFTVDGISDSASVHPTAMTMDNRTATLELGAGADPGQTVTVSFDPDKVPNTEPSLLYPNGQYIPLRYTDGTLVPEFSGAPVTIGPDPPTASVSFVSGATVELSWTLPAQHPDVRVTAVELSWTSRTKPDLPGIPDFRPHPNSRFPFAATGPKTWAVRHGGVTHYYRVRLVTNFGDVDSEVVSWTSDQDGLRPATGLTASNATQTTVDLAWTLPDQPAWAKQVANWIWSEVQQQQADGTWSTMAKLAGDAVAHTVTGLSTGTAYSFRVKLMHTTHSAPSEPVSVTTLDDRAPLTAAFHDVPATHGGRRADFSFELRFSENFPGKLPYKKLRDEALSATNGRVTHARRAAQNQNQRWIITVRPLSSEDVTVTLAATTDCSAAAAICTPDGRPLSNSPSATIQGASAPQATGVKVSSDAGADSTYVLGDTIRVTLTFSQPVEVTGTPQLKIDMDPAHWGEKWASYESGGGDDMTFAHVVVEPNFSTQGIAVLANTLRLNGGTIRSKATDAAADLAHAGLAHDPAHKVDWRQSASAGDVASGDVVEDPLAVADEALAVADGLSPDEAAAALFGEGTLSEARQAALDRLGNRNGGYDLGDLLSWIERCRRGEARCGGTPTDSSPTSGAALVGAAAAGRRGSSRRRGRSRVRGTGRQAGKAGWALTVLLATAMTWSCTGDAIAPTAPAATVPDPGFLTVEWSGPAARADIGGLLELEGPTIDAVRASGLELYESGTGERHQIVVAGVLRPGPLMQFHVPDRNQFAMYRVRVLQVTGEGYGLRDPTEYRAVVVTN